MFFEPSFSQKLVNYIYQKNKPQYHYEKINGKQICTVHFGNISGIGSVRIRKRNYGKRSARARAIKNILKKLNCHDVSNQKHKNQDTAKTGILNDYVLQYYKPEYVYVDKWVGVFAENKCAWGEDEIQYRAKDKAAEKLLFILKSFGK
jgi:hypothetical protein